MSKAGKVIKWLESMELPSGGIAHSAGSRQAYPEVSGYLIPTLCRYGKVKFAERLADWLASVQNEDGSWNGIDGVRRSFDTSAIVEGLRYLDVYEDQVDLALTWLDGMVRTDGALRIQPGKDQTNIYTMRASAIMESEAGADYWLPFGGWDKKFTGQQRPHYIAYGLEGLWRMCAVEQVETVLQASRKAIDDYNLMPFWCNQEWERVRGGTCTTSTAQFAMLYRWAGMAYKNLIKKVEAVIDNEGKVQHDAEGCMCAPWAAKFYLDALDTDYV